MSDNELKNLLEGLFTDFPAEPPPPSGPEAVGAPTSSPGGDLLARAVDSIADAVIIADRNGIIQFVNPAFQDVTGYSAEEALGQKTSLFKSDRHPDSLYQEMWDTVLSGRVWRGELINKRKDGSTYQALLTISPILDEAGEVLQFVSVQRDVTGRRETEATLAHERDLMQVLAGISQIAASTLELNDLAQQVVDQAQKSLNLDFVGIYLFDEEEDRAAVLQAGSGEMGRRLVEEGHRLEVGGDSAVGWSIAARQSRIVLDQDQQAENSALPGTGSQMALPLLARGQAIGALTLRSSEPAAFAQEDLPVMQNMADQVANAIERARLFWERERRVIELAVVNEIGRVISLKVDQEELLETVFEQVSRIFDTSSFYIAICDLDTDQVTIPLNFDHGERMEPVRLEGRSGYTGYIIETGRPVLLRDLEANRAFRDRNNIELIGDEAHSWMGVPLTTADEMVGAMALQSYDQEHLYDRQGLTLFFTIADQVATAIQNMRLLAESRRRAQELELLNQAGQTISSVLDLNQVLIQIVDTIKEQYDHYFVGVSLLEGDRLVFQASSPIGETGERLRLGGFEFTESTSLMGSVIRSGEPVLVSDVLQEPRYLSLDELPDTRSELDLPIRFGGEVIGVMGVQNSRVDAFGPADVTLLQSLANQAGATIQNARLFEETHRRADEMAALNELAQALTGQLDAQQVMEEAYRGASRMLDVSNFYIGLYDPAREEIAFAFHETESVIDQELDVIPADQGISGYIIRHRRPMLISDRLAERMEELGIEALGELAASWIGVPMVVGDRVLGVIGAQDYSTPHVWDQHDLELMTAIGNQTAVALQNAQLFEQAQRQLAEQSALQETTTALAVASSFDEAVRSLLPRVAEAVNADQVSMFLVRGEQVIRAGTYPAQEESDTRLGQAYPMADYPLTQEVLRTRRPLAILADDPALLEYAGDAFQAAGITASATIPLVSRDEILGFLALSLKGPGQAFSDQDIGLLQTLAGQAMIAFERVRLLDELTHRASREQTLREITTRVRGSTNPAAIMRAAVQELGDALGRPTFVRLAPAEELIRGGNGDAKNADTKGGE